MIARIDEARSNGDTVGGVFEVVVHGLPIGLGSYVQWDRRLDAALAAAVMSINIVKGVEFGLGFEQTRRFGSAVHDVIEGRGEGGRWIHRTNNAGGLTGGVTNGEPLVVRGAVKPISTLAKPLPSADLLTGKAVDKAHYERSDISVVPAAGVVGEAMVMLTLADAMLDKFGGDSMAETKDNLDRYRERISAPSPVAEWPATRWRRRPVETTARRAPAGTTSRAMDVVLVGLPGSGKSAVGRAARPSPWRRVHRSRRCDRAAAGRTIPEIFADDGEAAFRALERAAVAELGSADRRSRGPAGGRDGRRRGRRPAQPLGALPRAAPDLARRPAGGPRPAARGEARTCGRSSPARDPIGAIRVLARDRERFYAAGHRLNSASELGTLVERVDEIASREAWRRPRSTAGPGRCSSGPRPRAATSSSAKGSPATEVGAALAPGRGAGVRSSSSEPGAWSWRRAAIADRLAADGWTVETVMLRGRGGEAPGGRSRRRGASSPGSGRNGASRSSRSAAGRSATRPASSPRPGSGAFR